MTLSILFAIAATATVFLPLHNALLAVDCRLAERAIDRRLGFWHDHVLADDAEGIREDIKAIKLLFVTDTVFCDKVGCAKPIDGCLC